MNRNVNIKAYLLFFVMIISMTVRGEEIVAIPLPTQRLLPVAQVHAVLQDEEGYMWYATQGGLCRDNGYQIDVFASGLNDGGVLQSNDIINMALVSGHCIAFGTSNGLYILNKENYTMQRLALPGAHAGRIEALFTASDNSLWTACDKSIYHFDKSLKLLKVYKSEYSTINFYEDYDHNIWQLRHEGGLERLRRGEKQFVQMAWNGADPTKMVSTQQRDQYWVGTFGNGIVRYNAATGSITTQAVTLDGSDESRSILDMVYDQQLSVLWISTMDNLYAYSVYGDRLKPYSTASFLTPMHRIVDKLTMDRNGNLWVSGFSPTTFILLNDRSGIRRITVPEMERHTGFRLLADRFVKDADGYYWIWQGRSSLSLYHEGRLSFLKYSKSSGLSYVERTIQRCGNTSGIYASESGRLFRIFHEGMSIKSQLLSETKGNVKITAIAEDSLRRLWIGTRDGMYLYSILGRSMKRLCKDITVAENKLAVNEASAYALDSEGHAWIVKADGSHRRLSLGNHFFQTLALSQDGALWLGTRNGEIYKYEEGKLQHNDYIGNGNGQGIIDMRFDGTGHLWVLTGQTVSEYNPVNHSHVTYSSGNRHLHVDYFYALEPENVAEMGVAGAGAYCVFASSRALNQSVARAIPHVTSIYIPGEGYRFIGAGKKYVDIEPGTPTFTLYLSTLDVINSAQVSFAYRLGDKGSWIQLEQGSNAINLLRLAKGRHRLYVKATDKYGCWGKSSLCLTINILPAWYETWWAKLLLLIIIAALAYGMFLLNRRIRYLDKLQRLQKKLSLHKVELRTEDIKTDHYNSELMKKLIDVIEANMGDTMYNVERLGNDMAMSRINLYRKVKELTGKTPVELIREIRLKQAARLLLDDTNASVADIALKVGFATPSYFAKCFKTMFGVKPNEYSTKMQQNEQSNETNVAK